MEVYGLLANSRKLRQPEFVDLFQGSLELLPVVIILGKSQDVLASLLRQLGRQDQEICSDSIQGGVEIFFGKTESFEPMNNVVSQRRI